MWTYILFLLGFVLLIKGADLLVDGASSIAKRLGISDIVIGLTIVSLGTSAPELLVNEVIDAFKTRYDVTVSVVQTATENVEFKVPRVLRTPA